MTRDAVIDAGASVERWFARLKGAPEGRIRLFCFPFAGVGPSAFRGWGAALGNEVEVYAAQLPGRESRLREAPLPSIPSIVGELERAILPLIDRPWALFGHSL